MLQVDQKFEMVVRSYFFGCLFLSQRAISGGYRLEWDSIPSL